MAKIANGVTETNGLATIRDRSLTFSDTERVLTALFIERLNTNYSHEQSVKQTEI